MTDRAAPGLTDAECDAIGMDICHQWQQHPSNRTTLRALIRAGYAAHQQGQGEPVARAVVSTRDGSIIGFHLPWEKAKAEDHPWVKCGAGRVANVFIDAAQGQVSASGLYAAIAHGDAKHRTWLREAVDAYFAGEPIPAQDAAPAASPPAGAVAATGTSSRGTTAGRSARRRFSRHGASSPRASSSGPSGSGPSINASPRAATGRTSPGTSTRRRPASTTT